MRDVRSALRLTAVDSYISVALQLASTVVIARLLTPAELGTFAVAAVFAALAATVRDFGVGEFLIQEKDPTTDVIRAALGVNIAVSWSMAALMAVTAAPVAAFYGTPGVGDVMRVQAFSFLLIPFGAVTMAWFRREMRFKEFVSVRIAANVVAFLVAVVLAWRGLGFMSLAWSALAGVITTVAIAFWLRPPELPRWPSLRGAGRILRFGQHVSGVYIVGQIGRGAPEMIIGRAQDMAAVGMFSRGQGLVEIFNMLVLRAVTPVSMPYFAAEVRATGSCNAAQLRAMQLVTGLGWPFLASIALMADIAIWVVYGPQWSEATAIARLLCAAAMMDVIYFTAKEALLSRGLASHASGLQLVTQLLKIAGLSAAFAFGLAGAAWGVLVASAFAAGVAARTLRVHMGLGLRASALALRPSLWVTLCTALPLAAFWWSARMAHTGPWLLAAGGAAVAALAWVLAMRWSRHPLGAELARMLGPAGALFRQR